MKLLDGSRQVVAGILAATAFLGLYSGLAIPVWLAFSLGVAVYAVALFLFGRRRPQQKIPLGAAGSAADIRGAAEALQAAQERLDRAAGRAPLADVPAIAEMAVHIGSIRRSLLEHPEDCRPRLRFVTDHLPTILRTVETYVKLAGQTRGDLAVRLHDVSGQIKRYDEAIERVAVASIENDIKALESEMDVLSRQLDGPPAARE